MKKLYLLCFVTIAALFIDVALFHPRTVSAQATTRYEVKSFPPNAGPIEITGPVAGFSCSDPAGTSTNCYVLVRR
jgi:hypothetical protein